MCASFDASFSVFAVHDSRLLVAVAIGLALNTKRRHGPCEKGCHKGVVHFHLREEPEIRHGQKCGAPKQHSALDDISNADAFLFVFVFVIGSHGTAGLPLQGNWVRQMLLVLRPLIMYAWESRAFKELIVAMLEQIVERTDNDLDDLAVKHVREMLLPDTRIEK